MYQNPKSYTLLCIKLTLNCAVGNRPTVYNLHCNTLCDLHGNYIQASESITHRYIVPTSVEEE